MIDLDYIFETERYKRNSERFRTMAEGILPPNMIDWLWEMGYFFAPAAKSHHGANICGLIEHSMAVAEMLDAFTCNNDLEWEREESPIIIGLLHDICKVDDYIIIPNQGEGTEQIQWNDNQMYPGHGDKSLQMVLEYINDNGDFHLTTEENVCIKNHMGPFMGKDMWKYYSRNAELYENVLWTHHADMICSRRGI